MKESMGVVNNWSIRIPPKLDNTELFTLTTNDKDQWGATPERVKTGLLAPCSEIDSFMFFKPRLWWQWIIPRRDVVILHGCCTIVEEDDDLRIEIAATEKTESRIWAWRWAWKWGNNANKRFGRKA